MNSLPTGKSLALIAFCVLLVGSASLIACAQQTSATPATQPASAAPSSPVRTEGESIREQTAEKASSAPSLAQPASSLSADIANFAMSPATITVPVGGTVTWTNRDSAAHTITERNRLFDSGRMSQGATFSYTFKQAGTFEYFCDYHPRMTGKVIVTQ